MGGVCSGGGGGGGMMKHHHHHHHHHHHTTEKEFEPQENIINSSSSSSAKLNTPNHKSNFDNHIISVSDVAAAAADFYAPPPPPTTTTTNHHNNNNNHNNHKYDLTEMRLSFSSELKPPHSRPTAAAAAAAAAARTGIIAKVPQMSTSIWGRAGMVGLEKAVEVLDTLGSSITNLNPSTGFVYGMASRGTNISILAFEVANTVVKGANLLQSLSHESIQMLKQVILHSDGVNHLVSNNMEEVLLSIAAADKREEFDVFAREVVRFGDLCKDPQWHNLGRYFQKLESDVTTHTQLKEEADRTIQELITLAQYTSELYHELPPLDRLEQDYQRKLEELQSLNLPRKGESVMVLHGELKHQRKHVRTLKKKSLWSRNLDEVVEKLVDIVTFIHQEIYEVFSCYGPKLVSTEQSHNPQRLGPSGLALHYANIINQIDSIVSRPSFLPPNMRDSLYHGLPTGVKTALRSRLQSLHGKEELTVAQIKVEMGKTLQWLAPVAANTTKAHQGFGWVGEWANTGSEFNAKTSRHNSLMRLQTLYHAEKEKTEMYILELVTWLHRLISQVRNRDQGLKPLMPIRSPSQKGLVLVENQEDSSHDSKTDRVLRLSREDQDMLKDVSLRRLIPGISKSQEFGTGVKKRRIKKLGMSRSIGSSPTRDFNRTSLLGEHKSSIDMLDVMDGLDTKTH